MKIKKLHLRNFRCFEDFKIEFNTGDEKHGGLTVLVAKNGEGKTAILDAINVAWGPFISKMPQARGAGFGQNDATVHGEKVAGLPWLHAKFEDSYTGQIELSSSKPFFEISRELTSSKKKPTTTIGAAKPLTNLALELFRRENAPVLWPLIAYYGDSRLWGANRITEEKTKALLFQERSYGYAFATDPKTGYKEFEKWYTELSNALKDAKDKSDNGLDKVVKEDLDRFLMLDALLKRALKEALTITGWTSLEYLQWRKMIFATNANTGDRVPWTSLSAGNRIIIGLVADIAHRCCKLNPQENDNVLQTTPGIVLIDEIELHLHPSWQQQILPTLQKIFPRIQFIVTTHSPQVVSSVPKECVRVISEGRVSSFDIQTQGVEVGDILEKIFGTYPTPFNLEVVQKLNQLSAMVSEGLYDTEEWLKLYQELEGYYGKGYGPLSGIVEHKNFLKRLNKERENA